MVAVDLTAILTSSVDQARPLMQFKNQLLGVRCEGAHPWLTGGRNRPVQAMVNLLNKATKYTPDVDNS
jgi:signal transduction histidine kinase